MFKKDKLPLYIFHDLDNTPQGTKLDEWPLHITIVPYFFQGKKSRNRVIDKIKSVADLVQYRQFVFITGE